MCCLVSIPHPTHPSHLHPSTFARYQWASIYLSTISRGPSRKPCPPLSRLKHKSFVHQSSCFSASSSSRVTSFTFLLLLLSQGCDSLFFSTEACRAPSFVSCAHASGFLTPFLDAFARSPQLPIGRMQLNRGTVVCFFYLFCSSAGKCNLSSAH